MPYRCIAIFSYPLEHQVFLVADSESFGEMSQGILLDKKSLKHSIRIYVLQPYVIGKWLRLVRLNCTKCVTDDIKRTTNLIPSIRILEEDALIPVRVDVITHSRLKLLNPDYCFIGIYHLDTSLQT